MNAKTQPPPAPNAQKRQLEQGHRGPCRLAFIVSALMALAGCGEGQDAPLIALDDWRLLDRSHDPTPHPDGVASKLRCAPRGVAMEAGVLEINTGLCPYTLVGFPLLRAVQAGTPVRVLLSHGALASTEPATGHAVLALAGHVLMDRSVLIPSAEHIYDDALVVPVDVPADGLVVLHLHNHGANAWRLHTFEEEL